jgi:protein TonB
MFQDALVESSGKLRTKAKYFSSISIFLNGLILSLLILWPLIHPQALPDQALSMLLVAPAPPAPPAQTTRSVRNARAQTRPELIASQLDYRSRIARPVAIAAEAPPSLDSNIIGPGDETSSLGNITSSIGRTISPVVIVSRPRKLAISSGVMAGNKIAGLDPTYPAIARAAHIQGTVVLQATISKTGAIEDLRILSGQPMLVNAALDSVKTWRYRPYLLNGDPVEVDTTINVVFNLGD